jgi:hypothetical protein
LFFWGVIITNYFKRVKTRKITLLAVESYAYVDTAKALKRGIAQFLVDLDFRVKLPKGLVLLLFRDFLLSSTYNTFLLF